MQYCSSYMLILLLLHQYLAQEQIDEITVKHTKLSVEELLKKINDISVLSFSNRPLNVKLEMLQNVEEKLKNAAKSLGTKGERYVKIIMKGLKARALNEKFNNHTSKIEIVTNFDDISKADEKNNILNDSHIVSLNESTENDATNRTRIKPNLISRPETDNEDMNRNPQFASKQNLRRMNIYSKVSEGNFSHKKIVFQGASTDFLINSLKPRYECQDRLDKTCLNIKDMRQLKCHFDDSFIPIEKLCDGLTDCIDRTDEKFCTSQVTERIQNANLVINQVDDIFQLDCFPNKTKESVMSSQIIILRSVLEAQQEFVEKYKYFNRSLIPNNEYLKGEGTVKRAVNEISLIISSLSLALDAELCYQRMTRDDFTARKFNDLLIEDFDKVMEEVEWPPKSCVCKQERCENITTCTDACKRICWQKYSLTQWACPSINETENVPISVICDGKFDCFDQSDEKDCVTGISFAKFEAHNIFKEILSSLSTKLASKEYSFIRKMLLSLHNTIKDLQKFCMAPEPNPKIIRALRNKCFSALSSIYSETLTKSSLLYQKSELYVFLLSLNENIVNALKRSHTGNKRIISNDGCFCKNGRCSMPICSRNCVRSCIAEPWLTTYFCKGTNKTLPLDDICNGKSNCPREDDETRCEKEICRRHHLTVLRQSIQKIGKKQEGTSMGELLTIWKIKVSSTLLIAENNYRPNPNIIKDVIRDILNDLVATYGAVKDYRRDNEYALEEFTNIARYIMKFVRSCGY